MGIEHITVIKSRCRRYFIIICGDCAM